MAYKKFVISDTGDTSMEVELRIDTDVITEKVAHLVNSFWSDGEHRLDMAAGDVFAAVAKLAGGACMAAAMEGRWGDSPELIQRELLRMEGWPPTGIEVLRIDDVPVIHSHLLDCCEVLL